MLMSLGLLQTHPPVILGMFHRQMHPSVRVHLCPGPQFHWVMDHHLVRKHQNSCKLRIPPALEMLEAFLSSVYERSTEVTDFKYVFPTLKDDSPEEDCYVPLCCEAASRSICSNEMFIFYIGDRSKKTCYMSPQYLFIQ